MKKIIIVGTILIIIFIAYQFLYGDCGILPKDANYKIILDEELYTLTSRGLIEEGFIIDRGKTPPFLDTSYPRFNKAQNTIYFSGISKLDLTKHQTVPVQIPNVKGTRLSISPSGKLLLFSYSYGSSDIVMLNLKTEQKKKLVSDFGHGTHTPVWINDRQFLYMSDKNKIILFDINSMTKKDIQMDHYRLGEVSPDGKYILLSSAENTVLYNLSDHSTKVIMYKKINPTCMIWLPDGKGFLYLKREWYDLELAGLHYYSLEKKKGVQLIKKFSVPTFTISTGFIVPPDIEIKPVDNKHNKRRPLPMTRTNSLVKICNKKGPIDFFWQLIKK